MLRRRGHVHDTWLGGSNDLPLQMILTMEDSSTTENTIINRGLWVTSSWFARFLDLAAQVSCQRRPVAALD